MVEGVFRCWKKKDEKGIPPKCTTFLDALFALKKKAFPTYAKAVISIIVVSQIAVKKYTHY